MNDETPQAPDAERYVLGAALHDPTTLDTVTLKPSDFYRPQHEALWHLLQRMHHAGEPTEPLAVCGRLDNHPIRGIAGSDILAIYGECLSTSNVDYYAGRVREKADLRAVQRAGSVLAQVALHGSAEDAKAEARKILDGVDLRDTSTVRIGEVIESVLEEATGQTEEQTTPTPWPDLDDAITGLRPGSLYTIGARPGVGKSVIAAGIAWQVALAGKTAALFSLEMSRRDVTRRILAAAAGVDYGRLLRRKLTDLEVHRATKAWETFLDVPLELDDRSGITPAEIAATSRTLARAGNLGVVVVDYLQLVTPSDRRLPREQQVSEASRAMKVLAGDLGVPVVILSQLNRGVEQRQDKHPLLSDLRESGSLEQDSDVVLLLYRDEERSPDWLDVGVAKNRFGPTTAVRLMWEGRYQRATSTSLAGAA